MFIFVVSTYANYTKTHMIISSNSVDFYSEHPVIDYEVRSVRLVRTNERTNDMNEMHEKPPSK